MGRHPLIELANGRETKLAKGFRKVAADLSGASLQLSYEEERANAPSRSAAGKKFFVGHKGTFGKRRTGTEQDHVAMALYNQCQANGVGYALPGDSDDERVHILDYLVALKPPRVGDAPEDPIEKRIGKIDLFGTTWDDRAAVVVLRYLPADANRASTGDTPLRAMLEGLAYCAYLEANRAAIAAELTSEFDRVLSPDPPLLLILGSPRYWELCRKREAQKGALWIHQLERLAREMGVEIGVETRFVGLELSGDPVLDYREEVVPTLTEPAKLVRPWEITAGKLKPRSRSTTRTAAADPIIEADPSKPVRPYHITETFQPGDSIQHPTLGMGVVQTLNGPGKIEVLFGETRKLLIHERH